MSVACPPPSASKFPGFGLIIGILVAIWSASGYVGAFSRGMNRIYEIREGRPFWKLKPTQLLVTVVSIVLIVVADAELERGRELQAGIAAEEDIQLPPRDTRKREKAREKELKDVEEGRKIRLKNQK